jgi:methylated-DNA-[protein]-cysteine S-methyltransferase
MAMMKAKSQMERQACFFLSSRKTPIGTLLAVVDNDGRLRALDWADHEARMRRLLKLQYRNTKFHNHLATIPMPSPIGSSIDAYFSGALDAFKDIRFETGGSAFQKRVWTALLSIASGKTESYRALATRIGIPGAARAVGLANGANPIGIVIPCHRVIGANGALTGYGGGIERKRWLLTHEGAL